MPVDPFGQYTPDYGDYGEPGGYSYPGDGSQLYDIFSQGIHEAAQTAQVIGAGYPPGSNVSIQYPSAQSPQYPGQQYPQQPVLAQHSPQPSGFGLQISTTQAIIGGLILFAFFAGKRGR